MPAQLMQWGSRPEMLAAKPDTAVHFFIDDYRFESLWRQSVWISMSLFYIGCVLAPLFAFRDMPLVMQMWNVYRNRWLGCYWQAQGIHVIPTVSWSKPHDFCYVGVEQGSIVAISSVGLNDQKARYLFREGFEKMIEVISARGYFVLWSTAKGYEDRYASRDLFDALGTTKSTSYAWMRITMGALAHGQ